MEQVNIFLSSTYYDFKDRRKIIKKQIEDLGHKPILHEVDEIFYDPGFHTHESCIDSVQNEADILIVLIGTRFGGVAVSEALKDIDIEKIKDKSTSKSFFQEKNKYSITQCEVFKAIEKDIPILTFVEKEVWDARHKYEQLVKQGKSVDDFPFFSSDQDNKNAISIFEFISFINRLSKNNAIKEFTEVEQICDYLKKNLSAYFKQLIKTNNKVLLNEFELIPSSLPLERIADYFFEDYNRKNSILDVFQRLDFNEKGDCDYYSEISITPIDKLTHYHYQLFTDKIGKVEIKDFFVRETPEDRNSFAIKKGRHVRLNLLFNEPKVDNFTIILRLNIENYLSDLIDKSEGYLHRRIQDKPTKFKAIESIITFPNTKLFENLRVQVIMHPNPKYKNKFLKTTIIDGKKKFELNFQKADRSEFQVDTQLKFFLQPKKK